MTALAKWCEAMAAWTEDPGADPVLASEVSHTFAALSGPDASNALLIERSIGRSDRHTAAATYREHAAVLNDHTRRIG